MDPKRSRRVYFFKSQAWESIATGYNGMIMLEEIPKSSEAAPE